MLGLINSMRHLKNEVETIKRDVECGLRLVDQDIKALNGDTLICYATKTVKQTTDWDPGF